MGAAHRVSSHSSVASNVLSDHSFKCTKSRVLVPFPVFNDCSMFQGLKEIIAFSPLIRAAGDAFGRVKCNLKLRLNYFEIR